MRVRFAVLYTGALTIVSALSFACDPGTRIEGTIALDDGFEADDEERHTLYVAAFTSTSLATAIFNTSAAPAFVEFSGIENADFDPEVEFALGGAGAAEEMYVYAWWQIGDAEHADYEIPEEGDRFGFWSDNPVFEGASGDEGGVKRHIDVILDRTLILGSNGLIAAPGGPAT